MAKKLTELLREAMAKGQTEEGRRELREQRKQMEAEALQAVQKAPQTAPAHRREQTPLGRPPRSAPPPGVEADVWREAEAGAWDYAQYQRSGSGVEARVGKEWAAKLSEQDELRATVERESRTVGDNDLAAIPPEIGNLAALERLNLGDNARLSGPIPAWFAGLDRLERLYTHGTGLCAPPELLPWLEGVAEQSVPRCVGGGPAAYLVQAVQTLDRPVGLVAGEDALLRVFPVATRGNAERIPAVRATLHHSGGWSTVLTAPAQPGPIPTERGEGSLAASQNIPVRDALVRPGLEVVIEIDPEGATDPGLLAGRRVPAEGRLAADVRDAPTLHLTLVPFLYAPDPDSAIVGQVRAMADDPEGHELLRPTRDLLPVGGLEVAAHDPVETGGNSSWDLLSLTSAIRALEGGTGHWMGTISANIGGMAYMPGRVSVSVPDGETMAHELGHNFSLGHAPCSRPSYIDPAFPDPAGRTGAWGYDFRAGRLVSPRRPDVMGYCGGRWIAPYHFSKAFRFRLLDEAASSAAALTADSGPALLLWGGTDGGGAPFLEPALAFEGAPSLPGSAGDWTLGGLAEDGTALFSLAFAMPEIAHAEESRGGFAWAVAADPAWAGRLAAIVLSGPGGEARIDRSTNRPLAVRRDPRSGQVRAFLREGDAADALFSRGIPATRR